MNRRVHVTCSSHSWRMSSCSARERGVCALVERAESLGAANTNAVNASAVAATMVSSFRMITSLPTERVGRVNGGKAPKRDRGDQQAEVAQRDVPIHEGVSALGPAADHEIGNDPGEPRPDHA